MTVAAPSPRPSPRANSGTRSFALLFVDTERGRMRSSAIPFSVGTRRRPRRATQSGGQDIRSHTIGRGQTADRVPKTERALADRKGVGGRRSSLRWTTINIISNIIVIIIARVGTTQPAPVYFHHGVAKRRPTLLCHRAGDGERPWLPCRAVLSEINSDYIGSLVSRLPLPVGGCGCRRQGRAVTSKGFGGIPTS